MKVLHNLYATIEKLEITYLKEISGEARATYIGRKDALFRILCGVLTYSGTIGRIICNISNSSGCSLGSIGFVLLAFAFVLCDSGVVCCACAGCLVLWFLDQCEALLYAHSTLQTAQ